MNIVSALVKREILEGKNGYIRVPAILAVITLILVTLSVLGFGQMELFAGARAESIQNLADAITLLQQENPGEWPAAIMVGYWFMSSPVWVVLPFVVFFSLLGTLYEERRDRSVLFWKSMPVADWQEVLVKLAVPVIIAPLIYLAVTAVAQVLVALLLSIIVLAQGGSFFDMWPLGLMVQVWFSSVGSAILFAFWAMPLAAWVLFVSSFAERMPFMWAALPPVLIVVVEALFLDSGMFAQWFITHIGGWVDGGWIDNGYQVDVDGPREMLMQLTGGSFINTFVATLGNIQFWIGLIIAAGFTYGAIHMRKHTR